ncbi:hypothetical protein ACVJBD_006123 [Rhizobium mongolense]
MSHLKNANSTSKPIGPGRALRLHVYGGPEPLSVDPVSVRVQVRSWSRSELPE